MKYHRCISFIIILFALATGCQQSQAPISKLDVAEIKKVLNMQEEAWSKGDLEGFMQGYWKDTRLTFVGKNGIKYGWKTTLHNYREGYPDKEAMGKLHFEVLDLTPLSPGIYYMLGRYTLTRKEDEPSGIFSLVWKKIDDKWVIISDHTSG